MGGPRGGAKKKKPKQIAASRRGPPAGGTRPPPSPAGRLAGPSRAPPPSPGRTGRVHRDQRVGTAARTAEFGGPTPPRARLCGRGHAAWAGRLAGRCTRSVAKVEREGARRAAQGRGAGPSGRGGRWSVGHWWACAPRGGAFCSNADSQPPCGAGGGGGGRLEHTREAVPNRGPCSRGASPRPPREVRRAGEWRGMRGAEGYGWRCRVWSLPVTRLGKEGNGRRGATLVRQVTRSDLESRGGWVRWRTPIGGSPFWWVSARRRPSRPVLHERPSCGLQQGTNSPSGKRRKAGWTDSFTGVSQSRPVTTTVFPRAWGGCATPTDV